MVIEVGSMGEKQDKQNKHEKKVNPPPQKIDPKLAKTVELKEKPRNKKTYRFEK